MRIGAFFRKLAHDEVLPVDEAARADPVHVRVEGVCKSYGDHQVLKDVTFDILRGKTNLLIGPSGSGKTVAMRQLIRLEEPDAGRILVNGADIAHMKGRTLDRVRNRMGMVFQMSALFDSMTVFENVAFPLREHTRLSRSEIRDRVMARLESLGIGHAHKKMPSELSGGMQRRVAVARALIHETEIIIYDEPTTGLDPITTRTVDELILEAQEKFGVTSMVISHDMASVFRIADRITFLNYGHVVASCAPGELLDSLTPDLAEYIRVSGVSEDILKGVRR